MQITYGVEKLMQYYKQAPNQLEGPLYFTTLYFKANEHVPLLRPLNFG